MLIAEDLLLLLLDDEEGTLAASAQAQTALGGAVLAELAIDGSVEVGEKGGFWQTAKVRASGPAPEDPLLRAAHATVAEKERSAQDLVDRLGRGLRDDLADRLVERGILRREERRILGIFPSTRWPTVDASHERQVRDALVAVLVQGLDPDPRTGTLVALLSALDRAHKVVGDSATSSRDVRKRAKAVAEGQWAVEGVSDAIAAANAAVVAAIVASTAATTATSSSS